MILDSINYENNFQILAQYFIKLGKKHPNNKVVDECSKALKEMYFYTNTLQIQKRELILENSNIKQETRKQLLNEKI